MPSASTASPISASVPMLSSLCERTMPGSVAVATSRAVPRLAIMALDSNVHDVGFKGVSAAAFTHTRANRLREFLTGLKALFRLLRQRFIDDVDHALRKRRYIGEDIGVRLIRN